MPVFYPKLIINLMENKPDIFPSGDGKKMFFQHWAPPGQPLMLIALVHGIGEHSGRYTQLANMFCRESIALAAFDLRGHGSSEGKRGHFPSLELVFDDIDMFLEKASSVFPGVLIVLYGQSLGGNLAINYLLHRKYHLSALILSSPWFRLVNPPSPALKTLVGIMDTILPSLTASSRLDVNSLSRDSAVVERYQSDLLVHDRVSYGTAFKSIKAGEEAIARAGEVSIPVLVMHGTGDKITSHDGSRAFVENGNNHISFKLWERCYHELHNEPEKEMVFRYIVDWLKKNVKQGYDSLKMDDQAEQQKPNIK
jgi:alpha-beta hydrolase superfamily lysophospholipase